MPDSDFKLVNFRATLGEIALWDDVAHAVRKSRTQWMRDVLNSAASGIPVKKFVPTPVSVETKTKAKTTAAALLDRAKQAGECINRVPSGAYCTRCGRIHV